MKQIIKSWFQIKVVQTSEQDLDHALKIATATLLVEVMRADFVVQPAEQQRLRDLLETQFQLTAAELDAIISEANDRADQMVSLQHITRLMNEHYDHTMKLRVVEMMWSLIFADGEKDHYEEHLIRQVAELLYLSHAEFIQARHRAEGES